MDNTQNRKIIILCLASAFANAAFSYIISGLLNVPLYVDTIFTVAMCFTAGMFSGILTGAVFSPLFFFIVFKFIMRVTLDVALIRNVFVICIFAEIFLVCYFYNKIKTREADFLEKLAAKQDVLFAFFLVAVQLLFLVVLDCIIISVLGGIIELIIEQFSTPWKYSPSDIFKLGFLRNNAPSFIAGILSQFPINIVDRFIAVFGGYGISLIFRRWLSADNNKIKQRC